MKWISEQMTFHGPKKYVIDPDSGPTNESIVIIHEIEQIAHVGKQLQGTLISYNGPGVSKAFDESNLSLDDAKAMTKSWGYDDYSMKDPIKP